MVCMFDIFSLRLLNLPIIENYYVLEKRTMFSLRMESVS